MTPAATEKRLDKIEVQLTPREWAIRLADESRQYLTAMDYLRATAKETRQQCLVLKAFHALKKQAEERHPGNKPADIQLRNQLYEGLRNEYHTLKVLQIRVDWAIANQVDPLSLRVALKFSQLHTLILQDAFGQSAGDNARLGGQTPEHLTWTIKDWVQDATALANDVFALPAAVQLVQDQHFDGHPILFHEWESMLTNVVDTVEDGIDAFNQYIQTKQHEAESAGNGQRQVSLVIDIPSLKTDAKVKAGAALVDRWFKEAQDEATDDYLKAAGDEWLCIQNRIRELVGQQS